MSLPSHLSAGNLAFPEFKDRSEYHLYTTRSDLLSLRSYRAMDALTAHMPVKLFDIDELTSPTSRERARYEALTLWLRNSAGLSFPGPAVGGRNSSLGGWYRPGRKRLVAIASGLRLDRETLVFELLQRYEEGPGLCARSHFASSPTSLFGHPHRVRKQLSQYHP